MRHRIFRRSHDSKPDSPSNPRHSRETTASSAPASPDKDVVRDKRERPRTSGKGSERLSIFGNSFGGTLGKSRKPAPKYPSFVIFLEFHEARLKKSVEEAPTKWRVTGRLRCLAFRGSIVRLANEIPAQRHQTGLSYR